MPAASEFLHPPVPTTLAFLFVLSAVQAFVVAAARDAQLPLARVFAVLVSAALVSAGLATYVLIPERFPTTAAFFFGFTALTLWLSSRPFALRLSGAFSLGAWVLVQAFRLPLEIILHSWSNAGTVPPQMTWSGQNFDVVAGVAALLLGIVVWRTQSRRVALAFHLLGLGLLLNVIRIAMTSTPGPMQVFDEPLLLAFHAPYVWIVPFAVMSALFMHIISLRRILQRPHQTSKG